MDTMTLFSGKIFNPTSPDPAQIAISDIAHALSLLCRGNGHIKYFYSVAQHSINCAKEAQARNYSTHIQFYCLMHDASEAYLADIIRPVKKHISQYYIIEKTLQDQVYLKYTHRLPTDNEYDFVGKVDDQILAYELNTLMNGHHSFDTSTIKGDLSLEQKPFSVVEQEFIEMFNQLCPTVTMK